MSRSWSVAATAPTAKLTWKRKRDVGQDAGEREHRRQDALPLSCWPTTGPTISVPMTSKAPIFACWSAATTASASRLRFAALCAAVCATRTMHHVLRRLSVILHDGVVADAIGHAVTAARTRSIGVACWNLTMTMLPPAKSTPSERPRVQIVAAPARITTSDSAMACQRQRTKS